MTSDTGVGGAIGDAPTRLKSSGRARHDHHHHPGRRRPGSPRARRRRPRSLDREVGPAGRPLLGLPRQGDRQAQPRVLDLRRAHRLLRLDAVVDRRRVDVGHLRRVRRARLGRGGRLGAHRRPGAHRARRRLGRRRRAPHPLHLRRADLRRPQLDRRLGPAPPRADARPRLGRPAPRGAVLGAAPRRGHRRLRRRQLRLLDGQHQLLLPREGEGLGARPQRRRGQHRRRRRAEGRAARDRPRWRRRRPGQRRASSTSRSPSSRPCSPTASWTTCARPRPTPAPRPGRPGTCTPGSWRCSTSAPSARSSATRQRSPPCSRSSSSGPTSPSPTASSAPSSARSRARSAAGSPTGSAARSSPS